MLRHFVALDPACKLTINQMDYFMEVRSRQTFERIDDGVFFSIGVEIVTIIVIYDRKYSMVKSQTKMDVTLFLLPV